MNTRMTRRQITLGEGMPDPLFAVFAQRIGGKILDITWAWAIQLGVQYPGLGVSFGWLHRQRLFI